MKVLNNYITESGRNESFRKIYVKEKTGVAFTKIQEKYKKDKKKNTNIKFGSHCFHCGKQYHWATECTNLEKEQRRKIHTNVGTVKDNADKECDTIELIFFENNHKKKKNKSLDPNKIYLDRCYTYNKLME